MSDQFFHMYAEIVKQPLPKIYTSNNYTRCSYCKHYLVKSKQCQLFIKYTVNKGTYKLRLDNFNC